MNFTAIVNDIMAALSHHINDRPKCIFMSEPLYEYLNKYYLFDLRRPNNEHIDGFKSIYGIPVKPFESEDYEWWLSWEKYSYKNT